MDSFTGCADYETLPKRLKLDVRSSMEGVLCSGTNFSNNCDNSISPIGTTKDLNTSPQTSFEAKIPPVLEPETTEQILPAHPDVLDTSHDSLELDDDNASTISHLSEISSLSEISGEDWKPMVGSMIWIQKQMQNGMDPRTLLNELGVDSVQIPQHVNDVMLWKLIINMLAEPPKRRKLRNVNTLNDVVRLLKGAKNIIVLTGAGVSVSCGIPDFRSRDGVYLRLAADFPNLPDPQAMFDINFFNQDPRPFYKFAKDIYPGNFQPSPCHRFLKLLEKHKKLLRNYTQNIDTLEKVADIERVVECHGSFATATCTKCNYAVTADAIRDTILNQRIPFCVKCHSDGQTSINPDDIKEQKEELSNLVLEGIMKPDIVFFGEGLPDVFHEAMAEDKTQCDLLLVIGSSLKVRPVALIPTSLPTNVPQILINREPLPHCHFDVELLGDCDVIVNQICHMMGDVWTEGVYNPDMLQEALQLLPLPQTDLVRNNIDSAIINNQNEFCFKNSNLESSSISSVYECTVGAKSSSSLENGTYDSNVTIEKESIISSVSDDNILTNRISKERHMSIDSTRDSGIGENSNFADIEKFEVTDDTEYDSQFKGMSSEITSNHKKPLWQSKSKKSLADRLAANTFYLVPPSRYIFPGAEVYYDPKEKYTYSYDTSSSDSSESESDVDNSFQD